MLGIYNVSGNSSRDLSLFGRLEKISSGSLFSHGPLAVSPADSTAFAHSLVGDVWCAMDGVLYGAPGRRSSPDGPRTHSATLAGRFRERGAGCFSALRGRYSAVVWDDVRREGALVCDPMATRDLFVTATHGGLVFSSELSELLSCVPRRPSPDADAVVAWLAQGVCPNGRTLYEGVFRLGPGQFVPLGQPGLTLDRYWRPQYAGTVAGTLDDHARELGLHLDRAAAQRLSGASTAVILSGGIDSSVVTAASSRTRPPGASLTAYSCVFPGTPYDESEKSRSVASTLGVDWVSLDPKPQGAVWLALEFARRWESPVTGPTCIVDYVAAKAASEDGAEVLLDGQIGDELFGLAPYLISDRLRRAQLHAAIGLAKQWPMGRAGTPGEVFRVLRFIGLAGAVPSGMERLVDRRDKRRSAGEGPPWLLPTRRPAAVRSDDHWTWKRENRGPLWWRYLVDRLVAAPHRELRLNYLRHRAALHNMVGDPPLCDRDLIEHTLRIPPELAFDWRFTRPVVREAMRGVLPEAIRLQQRKAEFDEFTLKIMTGPDASGMEHLLLAPDAEIYAYVDKEWVRNMWARLQQGQASSLDTVPLWRMVIAEIWLRTQVDNRFPEDMLSQPNIVAPEFVRMQT